jgi:GTP pyrophosphokinase
MKLELIPERTEQVSQVSNEDNLRLRAARERTAGSVFAGGVGGVALRLGMDADCAIAAMLFAAAEDNGAPLDALPGRAAEFGERVALLVGELGKIAAIRLAGKSASEAESVRKMLFALVSDVSALFIKLAERLQTLRCAGALDEAARKKTAEECLAVYAPLADRFGVSWLKDELEDLSLKYLNHDAFTLMKELVAQKTHHRRRLLTEFEERLRAEAEKAGIRVEVASRAKHFYSVYQKMRKLGKSPGELYDLFGTRILSENTDDCYTLLSLVHKIWQPVERRFKDYIANPKENGYQSLHTTLCVEETYIEVQIRTFEMHCVAEQGIASHWLYKKGMSKELVSEKQLPLVNKLKDCLRENSSEYLAEVKKELLGGSVLVFTPKGRVVELPAGATALDFAYFIHEAVGEHCSLARADGKIIPLDRPLENTRVIEIVTSQAVHPHKNWLEHAVTTKALNRIRHYLTLHGELQAAHGARGEAAGAKSGRKPEARDKSMRKDGASVPAPAPQSLPHSPPLSGMKIPVRVSGEKNFLVSFARCCNPSPGSAIIGFVSRARGIIIHRADCKNLVSIKEFAQRKISAEWDWQA